MIILYVLLGVFAFILLLTAIMLFVPVKTMVKGTYWDKKPVGQMDTYWVKYFLGARLRIRDTENLHLVIWMLGIPLPLKLPLQKGGTDNQEEKTGADPKTEALEDPIKVEETEESTEKSFKERLHEIGESKDTLKQFWAAYHDYFKEIYVSYVTFSLEFIDTEIGLEDPAQTGIAAGIVYTALSLRPLENVHVNWNYAKAEFNISAGIKMTMNLYGILRTLLSLYFRYKKDKKNEVQ